MNMPMKIANLHTLSTLSTLSTCFLRFLRCTLLNCHCLISNTFETSTTKEEIKHLSLFLLFCTRDLFTPSQWT
ncbi:hypothetical protein Plhal304r1_c012g0047851 [Plasmopara halstedii]